MINYPDPEIHWSTGNKRKQNLQGIWSTRNVGRKRTRRCEENRMEKIMNVWKTCTEMGYMYNIGNIGKKW